MGPAQSICPLEGPVQRILAATGHHRQEYRACGPEQEAGGHAQSRSPGPAVGGWRDLHGFHLGGFFYTRYLLCCGLSWPCSLYSELQFGPALDKLQFCAWERSGESPQWPLPLWAHKICECDEIPLLWLQDVTRQSEITPAYLILSWSPLRAAFSGL